MDGRYLRSAVLLGFVFIGLVLSWYKGVLEAVWLTDTFYISSVIIVVAVLSFVGSFWSARIPIVGSFICVNIGFFGTIVGFILVLANAVGLDRASFGLALEGADIALYTTGVGTVCGMILWLQGVLLDYWED